MADERCAFPGGRPRSPGRWLDRETAERLLCGEPLESVDPAARDRAERLAGTLAALATQPPRGNAELPGEEGALAAFRAARTEPAQVRADDRRPGREPLSEDVGLVRIGPGPGGPRPRRERTVGIGLAAALTFGMVGGVVVAIGNGVLSMPFREDVPDPVASVSAAATPNRPIVSPSPTDPEDARAPGPGAPRDSARQGSGTGTGSGAEQPADRSGDGDGDGDTRAGTLSACRDIRDGKALTVDRRRTLVGAAGGASHIRTYCRNTLTGAGEDTAGTGGDSAGNADRNADRNRNHRDTHDRDHSRTGNGTANGNGNGNAKETGDAKKTGDGNGRASAGTAAR